jgi:hypothetical protein
VTATTNSGNTVNLSVMGGSCTISGPTAPATVTFTSTGPCLIFADAAATTNYALAMEQSQSMTVGALSQTITAPTIADRAYGSASFSIAGSTSATSGLAVAYSSDDTAVCTISGSGVVTSLAVGYAPSPSTPSPRPGRSSSPPPRGMGRSRSRSARPGSPVGRR